MESKKYTKDEIRGFLTYPLSCGDLYSLESFLPYFGEYDTTVNEYISKLEHAHKHHDFEYYDILAEELIEHYYENQDNYDFV